MILNTIVFFGKQYYNNKSKHFFIIFGSLACTGELGPKVIGDNCFGVYSMIKYKKFSCTTITIYKTIDSQYDSYVKFVKVE